MFLEAKQIGDNTNAIILQVIISQTPHSNLPNLAYDNYYISKRFYIYIHKDRSIMKQLLLNSTLSG